jgi:hypothetical protein
MRLCNLFRRLVQGIILDDVSEVGNRNAFVHVRALVYKV